MDGIQPYSGAARPVVAVHTPASSPSLSAVKGPADYLHAVRRRIWLALAVALPVAMTGTLFVLRMPPVYSVTASVKIEPPRVDPKIAGLVSQGDVPLGDSAADEKYVPNALAMLQSKSLLEAVVRDPALGLPASAFDNDPAAELMGKIKPRQSPQSSVYYLTYEGRDPNLISRTLNLVIDKFCKRAEGESRDAGEKARGKASATLDQYLRELKLQEEGLAALIKSSTTLAPGGKNLKEAAYDAWTQRLYFQQTQAGQLRSQIQLEASRPSPSAGSSARGQRIEGLEERRKAIEMRLKRARRISRDASDPAITTALVELNEVEDAMAKLTAASGPGDGMTPEQAQEQILSDAIGEIGVTQGRLDGALAEMRDAMPEHQKYTTLMGDRDLKAKQVAALKEKLSAFAILAESQKAPIVVIDQAIEPTDPIKPNRPVFIAGCIVLGLGLGLALVCLLEHVDHSVKVPEHLTAGLTLPLLGVVPRMRRNARNHRGGHLWTPGTPDSVEADAYRNLRASLLGATDRHDGPIVTLLVTSAKAGEGKSTTALNLAATCARAGERTLLMDVDLRRPSLHEVFPGKEHHVGLVDVLRGDLPWQRTVLQTDLPNLDFLPTGDTRDVPIEVLGSLELRQLLISLSAHHYDRVILDGPAVLGLADCRMLGRIVDAAVMVVRSGSQELRSLQRAKAMLEQSRVTIAGLVFNGLVDDLDNWSSYGPNPPAETSFAVAHPRPAGAPRGLGARPDGAAALVAAGSIEP